VGPSLECRLPQSGAPAVPPASAAPTEVFSTPALSLPQETRDDKAPALERSTSGHTVAASKVKGPDVLIQEPSAQTKTGVEFGPRPVSSPAAKQISEKPDSSGAASSRDPNQADAVIIPGRMQEVL
jgi:hypothetical protein